MRLRLDLHLSLYWRGGLSCILYIYRYYIDGVSWSIKNKTLQSDLQTNAAALTLLLRRKELEKEARATQQQLLYSALHFGGGKSVRIGTVVNKAGLS